MIALALHALTWIVPFLFVLTLVVMVHELGHFLAARACGVAVDRFSIGFGHALLRMRAADGVEWRVGWLPLGGYVRFAGDDNAASVPDAEDLEIMRREIMAREGPAALGRYFHFKPLWQRAVVVVAGPVANFVLSITLFALLLMTVGEVIAPARVDAVMPDSAAAVAGFKPGDVVVSANGRGVGGFADLEQIVSLRAGVPMRFVVRRGAGEVALAATPRATTVVDVIGGRQVVGRLGLENEPTPDEMRFHRLHLFAALQGGAAETWDVLDTTVYYLGRLVTGQVSADQLGGPLGIAQASHAVARAGAAGGHDLDQRALGSLAALLGLAAVMSVSIGFLNLLPVPVLDGGHLLFYGYEAVARRPVAARVQAASYRVGLALVLGLMLFATINDLHRIGVLNFLGGLFS